MTTIKDMMIAALQVVGAGGVAIDGYTWSIEALDSGERWPLPSDRPAFRDAEDRLVPLPDDWGARGNCLVHKRTGFLIHRGGRGWMFQRYEGQVESYKTAPEAWAAAEAWIKERGE